MKHPITGEEIDLEEIKKNMCKCGCCHYPDHGACPTFEQGKSGSCVYCDHAIECHERDKNNPRYNTPLGYGTR